MTAVTSHGRASLLKVHCNMQRGALVCCGGQECRERAAGEMMSPPSPNREYAAQLFQEGLLATKLQAV